VRRLAMGVLKPIFVWNAVYLSVYGIVSMMVFMTTQKGHPLGIAGIGLFFTSSLTAYLLLFKTKKSQRAVQTKLTEEELMEVKKNEKQSELEFEPINIDVDISTLDADDDHNGSSGGDSATAVSE